MNLLRKILTATVSLPVLLMGLNAAAELDTATRAKLIAHQQTKLSNQSKGERLPAPTAEVGPTPFIVGGEEPLAGEWPYIVALVNPNNGNSQFCGGSLIREDVVLTAAHCVDGAQTSGINVYLGSQTLSNDDGNGEFIAVNQIVMHEGYNRGSFENDVALLFLETSSSLPVVPTISSALMNGVALGEAMKVAGWGNMEPFDPTFPNHLQEVDVNYTDAAICEAAYEPLFGANSIKESMICAGTPEGGKDACHGDSGGPLIVNVEGVDYQAGVVSWGNPTCAQTGFYGVYAKVAYFEEWLDRSMNRHLEDYPVFDSALQACINSHAIENNWQTVDEVTALNCDSLGIQYLDGLESYTQLTSLRLAGNNINSLWPLGNINTLQIIDLSFTQVSDLSPLLPSTGLEEIYLFGSYGVGCLDPDAGPYTYAEMGNACFNLISQMEVEDESLQACILDTAERENLFLVEDLSTLPCEFQGITSLNGIEQAYNLNVIYLGDNDIVDATPLENIPNIVYLSLAGNSNLDTNTLSGLENIVGLDLTSTNLTSVDFLAPFYNLNYLYLGNNNIEFIHTLGNLYNLEHLAVWANNVSDISALADLQNLRLLDLFANNISDISSVANLTQLDILYLDRNLISDISALENLTQLWLLSLSYNNISDISALENLQLLTDLSLFGNYGITCVDVDSGIFSWATLPESCFVSPGVDSDNDGVNDGDDNCPNKPNANQKDTDGDGMGNRCDADDDNDGFTDAEENRVGSNTKDPNSTPISILTDADGDGIHNDVDNCVNKKNPNQKDFDLDGLGNACDPDDDNDGFTDAKENNVGSNPLNPLSTPETIAWDADGDGIDDSWDNCTNKSNPNQKDTDQDGMGNACDLDDDNDGFTDAEEKAAGTNPRNPNSYPS